VTTVAVKIDVLKWAVDRSSKSEGELLRRCPNLSDWLEGGSQPTLRQLEELSRATTTPLGLLFLDSPPTDRLPIPSFRTVDDDRVYQPSVELIETIQMMERRQAWMKEYLSDEREPPLDFVGSASLSESPVMVAQRMRKTLGFSPTWAAAHNTWTDAQRALREGMENTGILVVINSIVGNNTHRRLDTDEFRGFVLADKYAPLVFVNGDDSKAAQMFTLAHELAHLFFGSSGVFDLKQMMPSRDKLEQTANRVAAEFLVPEAVLRKAWETAQFDVDPFKQLSRLFRVSEIVTARRCLDLELIGKDAFVKFYKLYVARTRKKKERAGGADYYLSQSQRLGTRFANAVVRAVREGKLFYSEAYSLTGMYGKTFDNFARTVVV
jgi:Zn-dependent peptidase ImmA (M78 family)